MRDRKKIADIVFSKLQESGLHPKKLSKEEISVDTRIGRRKIKLKYDRVILRNREILFDDPLGDQNHTAIMHNEDILCYIDEENHIGYLIDWKKLFTCIRIGNDRGEPKLKIKRVNKGYTYSEYGWAISMEELRNNNYIFKCLILEDM